MESKLNRFAPIAVFAHVRLLHLQQTISALAKNPEAIESDLFIFSDGPRDEEERSRVLAVRGFLREVSGFGSVRIFEREENLGLSQSIIEGVGLVLSMSARVIVVEDDIVTSEHFLRFMNEGLEKYANDDRVASIHGYIYPTGEELPEVFFLRGADCWGWATWERAWDLFETDSLVLLRKLRFSWSRKRFDFNFSYPFFRMLRDNQRGRVDSWAIRWAASMFIHGKLTMYPGRSLVQNIGNDGTGRHAGLSDYFVTTFHEMPISLGREKVEDCRRAISAVERYFRRIQFKRAKKKLARGLRRLTYGRWGWEIEP